MNPISRREGKVSRALEGDLIVLGTHHDVHRLDAVAAWVWQHADGSRSVDALLVGLRAEVDANADRELVFAALDRLADAGLLEGRAAPPAGVTRRVTLQRLAGASALAALAAVVGAPGAARAAKGGKDDNAGCQDEKAIIDEIAYLHAQEDAVAELLEDWVAEAEAQLDDAEDETSDSKAADSKTGATASAADSATAETKADASGVDTYYVDALSAREVMRKKAADQLDADVDAAAEDLAACKVGPQQHAEQNVKKRATQLRERRTERAAKALHHSKERGQKRIKKSASREMHAKATLHAKAEKKGELDSAAYAEALNRSRSREKMRKRRVELHLAARTEGIESQLAGTNERIDAVIDGSKTRYLAKEKRSKYYARSVADRAQEESHKALGGSDYILEIAQKEALIAADEAALARKIAQEQAAKQSETATEQKQKEAAKAQEQSLKSSELAQEKAKKAI